MVVPVVVMLLMSKTPSLATPLELAMLLALRNASLALLAIVVTPS
ncbi:hypothetical protein APY03_5325 [Variovorax sp. WDL1]|nr:hypothetical protein APY03_5325 [Variovorax sp. WDL1]